MARSGWFPALGLAIALGLAPVTAVRSAAAEEIVVFAAASLKTALDEIASEWRKETGNRARISLAGSSKLARQIQQGAPADLFVSANLKWMDVLERESLIDATSRRNLLRNRIVLIAHGQSAPAVQIKPGFDLSARLKDRRIAMAMVDAVPAGIYGKAALTALGVWDAVASRVAQVDNVRAALVLVARGETPLGIVYATDAAASDQVTIAGTFPANSHPPIVYPAAITTESTRKAAARQFLDFLSSDSARAIFTRLGFAVPAAAPVN